MLLAVALAALYALFVWWFSTGLVMYVVGMPRFTHPFVFGFATLLMLASLGGLAAAADDPGIGGAYHAFTCTILVWAWVEIGFLLGYVTGPRREPLSPGASGAARFGEALAVLAWHEIALLAAGAAVLYVSAGGVNEVGVLTFAVLWSMRLSAKLNLFLGVPNRAEEMLPDRLAYLASYFAHRPMNLLFPLSVTAATAAAALMIRGAADPATSPEMQAGFLLVVALLALAILEHWFLVVPLPSLVLFRWGLASRAAGRGVDVREVAARRLVVVPSAVPSHRRAP